MTREEAQEPSDVISRDFLFKVLDDFCGHDRTATITLDTLADIVYELPSVTPKSDNKYRKEAKRWKNKWLKSHKSGEWIRHITSIECSACHEKFFDADENENLQDYDAVEDLGFNFCPNCGADMRGDTE